MMWQASMSLGYSNCETVQKNVEGRLSQQMVTNNSLFVTIYDCFGSSFEVLK